jgi:hypothetical protein
MAMKPAVKALFKGKETYKEELAEGKALKSGKITPKQYASGERMEDRMTKGKAHAKGKPAMMKKK